MGCRIVDKNGNEGMNKTVHVIKGKEAQALNYTYDSASLQVSNLSRKRSHQDFYSGQDNSNIIKVNVLEDQIIKKAISMLNLDEKNSNSSSLSNQIEKLNLGENNSNNLPPLV